MQPSIHVLLQSSLKNWSTRGRMALADMKVNVDKALVEVMEVWFDQIKVRWRGGAVRRGAAQCGAVCWTRMCAE
jgi:hypothetical protein